MEYVNLCTFITLHEHGIMEYWCFLVCGVILEHIVYSITMCGWVLGVCVWVCVCCSCQTSCLCLWWLLVVYEPPNATLLFVIEPQGINDLLVAEPLCDVEPHTRQMEIH